MRVTLLQAAKILNHGDVVAIPTETVYGLAARLSDVQAVQKIFALKNRPQDNPLIVHLADVSDLSELVQKIPDSFQKILQFWPGPLTVVLPANTHLVPEIVRAGLDTVALRVPEKSVTRELIRLTGPLVAPSANLSGKPSATRMQHVEDDFGESFPVLDDGPCEKGVESTVIRLTEEGWTLLRHGALPEEALVAVLGDADLTVSEKSPRSPGQKYRHYAPQCELILCHSRQELKNQADSKTHDAILGFDDTLDEGERISLGPRDQVDLCAGNLYAKLRLLDDRGCKRVLVDMDFEKSGLGKTLAERLTKAANKSS